MRHIHSITYSGSFPLDTWNRLLKFLFDNNIPYKYFSNLSPTRDDAGLNKWYERVIFSYEKYIPYYTNRKHISIKDFLELVNQ